MKFISFSFLIFAAVFLVSSAFPGVKDKDGSSRLVDPNNSKEQEKSLQRKKPPIKPPGPQLNSENKKPQIASLFLKSAEMKLLAPGPRLHSLEDNPKRGPIIPTTGELSDPPGASAPELKLTSGTTNSGFSTQNDGKDTKEALDCDKKKKEVFVLEDTDKNKEDEFLPLNKSKEKTEDQEKDLLEENRYYTDLNEDTHREINGAM